MTVPPGPVCCRSVAHLATLQPPSLLVAAAVLPHVTGAPGPGGSAPLGLEADGEPSPRPRSTRGTKGRSRTVPVFTIRNSVVRAVVDNAFQAAPHVALIVRGGPDGGHIDTPELVGYGDLQEPGSATSAGFCGYAAAACVCVSPACTRLRLTTAELAGGESATTIRVPSVGPRDLDDARITGSASVTTGTDRTASGRSDRRDHPFSHNIAALEVGNKPIRSAGWEA